jgi:hypothetical protein
MTVADERDDSQLTLLTAISAFGDSIPPMFITNDKTFDETALADQQLYHGHDYVMRTADTTFITESYSSSGCKRSLLRKTINFARSQTTMTQLSCCSMAMPIM